jgi:hypothetical protein
MKSPASACGLEVITIRLLLIDNKLFEITATTIVD